MLQDKQQRLDEIVEEIQGQIRRMLMSYLLPKNNIETRQTFVHQIQRSLNIALGNDLEFELVQTSEPNLVYNARSRSGRGFEAIVDGAGDEPISFKTFRMVVVQRGVNLEVRLVPDYIQVTVVVSEANNSVTDMEI